MKKYIARIVVMLLIASVLPLQVSAAEKESIELAVEAEQVGVSLTLPQSVSGNILSLQVGLKVDSNVQEETTATFQFSENVAKVADYRYNQEKGILNIYLSGTKTLFFNILYIFFFCRFYDRKSLLRVHCFSGKIADSFRDQGNCSKHCDCTGSDYHILFFLSLHPYLLSPYSYHLILFYNTFSMLKSQRS